MKKNLLTLTLLLCTLSLLAQRQFPTQIKHLSFKSEILGVERNFSIYLPRSYDREPDKYYPVLYLLHGHGENNAEWANIPLMMQNEIINYTINSGEACEMIIVYPDAGTVRNGYFNFEDWNYEDYFFKELLPYVESNYRIIADKGHRCIGGLSMGGGGAVSYAQSHPDMFGSVYAMSAAVGSSGTRPGVFNDCVSVVKNATPELIEKLRTINWMIDCGDADFLFDANVEFYQAMRQAQIPCQFRVRAGGHVSAYWYSGLALALPYFTRHFKK